MAYLFLQPCQIESEVDGENNKVRNQQKIDILSLDFATDEGDTCNVWSSYGFEAFEYIILTFLMISIVYWLLQKCSRKIDGSKAIEKEKKKPKQGSCKR